MALSFDPRNKFLATGDHDGVVIIWSLPSFTPEKMFQCPEGKEIHYW